jgi:hypothetical protein
MTVFSSMNFSSKGDLKRAVAAGMPIMLWSPVLQMPAITGKVRCTGPWPDSTARLRGGWKADVMVKDARIVEVR